MVRTLCNPQLTGITDFVFCIWLIDSIGILTIIFLVLLGQGFFLSLFFLAVNNKYTSQKNDSSRLMLISWKHVLYWFAVSEHLIGENISSLLGQ